MDPLLSCSHSISINPQHHHHHHHHDGLRCTHHHTSPSLRLLRTTVKPSRFTSIPFSPIKSNLHASISSFPNLKKPNVVVFNRKPSNLTVRASVASVTAKGFIKIGLENRVTYQFVKLFGNSSLGLGYSLVFSDALLAPAILSVSARAGGIFLPPIKALCVACGSNVGDGTKKKLGAWLMLTCFQTSVMFLTTMAAIVVGLASLVLVPLILYVIYPLTLKSSPDAPKLARKKLEKMGPMRRS